MLDEVQRRQTELARAALRAERERLQPVAEFTLWFRAPGCTRWVPCAIGESYSACFDQIDANTKNSGDWLVKPKGENPNEARKAK